MNWHTRTSKSTLRVKDLEKPTSQLYGSLLVAAGPELSPLRRKWVGDIPELDEDDWREIWDFPFSPLVSARDKLVQYNIVHRVYYTPHRLHQMFADVFTGVLALLLSAEGLLSHFLGLPSNCTLLERSTPSDH